MFTKEHLLQVIAEVPSEFSLEELAALLSQPRSAMANPTPPQATDWEYYTSPAAQALYARFSASPALLSLRGIASVLPAADLDKTAKDWEAERIQAKYGL